MNFGTAFLYPGPRIGDGVRLTVPTDHARRFMPEGFTSEPDKHQWENVLVVWRSDGQTDLYAKRVA